MNVTMRREADIVIVGAGVFGSLLAYELSRQTQKRIALVEAHSPGAGLSGESPGIIAVLDTDILNQQHALYAYAYYQQLHKILPGGIAFEEIIGKLHSKNRVDPFLAAQINPRELCRNVVTVAIQNKVEYLESGSVSSIHPVAGGQYLVAMASEHILSSRVILAVGSGLEQLLPTLTSSRYVNKAFCANRYSYAADALELYPQEDLYILPWHPYCVVGFLHRDHNVSSSGAVPNDPKAPWAIHEALCHLQPVYSGLSPLDHKVYVDNFTENNRARLHTDDETGIQYICGASGNGITQAPRFIQQIIRCLR